MAVSASVNSNNGKLRAGKASRETWTSLTLRNDRPGREGPGATPVVPQTPVYPRPSPMQDALGILSSFLH